MLPPGRRSLVVKNLIALAGVFALAGCLLFLLQSGGGDNTPAISDHRDPPPNNAAARDLGLSETIGSWNTFVETSKARIQNADASWKTRMPNGSLGVRFINTDLKKSDSVLNPFFGEISVEVTKDFGANDKSLSLQPLKLQLGIAQATWRMDERNGSLTEARKQELLKKQRQIEEEIRQAERQSDRVSSTYEYVLRFVRRDQSWVFSEGTRKQTRDFNREWNKDTARVEKLTEELAFVFVPNIDTSLANDPDRERSRDTARVEKLPKELAPVSVPNREAAERVKEQPNEERGKRSEEFKIWWKDRDTSLTDDASIYGLTVLSVQEAQRLAGLLKSRPLHPVLVLPLVTSLSEDAAKALVTQPSDLGLGLTALSDEVAEALANHEGELCLASLGTITDTQARALSRHKGTLGLFVTTLSDEAAEALATHQSRLQLDGLTTLSGQIAEALAKHSGELSLFSLKTLTDRQAKALAQHKGTLWLDNLTELSDEAAKALRANPNIDLPEKFRR